MIVAEAIHYAPRNRKPIYNIQCDTCGVHVWIIRYGEHHHFLVHIMHAYARPIPMCNVRVINSLRAVMPHCRLCLLHIHRWRWSWRRLYIYGEEYVKILCGRTLATPFVLPEPREGGGRNRRTWCIFAYICAAIDHLCYSTYTGCERQIALVHILNYI